jgi:hypothetical protein
MSEMQERIDDYLEFGVPYVWVINPINRRAFIYTPGAMHEAKRRHPDRLQPRHPRPPRRTRIARFSHFSDSDGPPARVSLRVAGAYKNMTRRLLLSNCWTTPGTLTFIATVQKIDGGWALLALTNAADGKPNPRDTL